MGSEAERERGDMIGQRGPEEVIVGLTGVRIRRRCWGSREPPAAAAASRGGAPAAFPSHLHPNTLGRNISR